MEPTRLRRAPVAGRVLLIAAPLLAVLLISGCATIPEVGQRQSSQPSSQTQTGESKSGESGAFVPQPLTVQPASPAAGFPRTIEASSANAAVIALYNQAQRAQAARQFGKAASAYERAMRLAPRNAFVWSALARLHLQMQQPLQAINKARKSNSLADGNPYVLQVNWDTIATAENMTGDSKAASQAHAEADKYAKLTSAR